MSPLEEWGKREGEGEGVGGGLNYCRAWRGRLYRI